MEIQIGFIFYQRVHSQQTAAWWLPTLQIKNILAGKEVVNKRFSTNTKVLLEKFIKGSRQVLVMSLGTGVQVNLMK